jgi:hypothetical protein
MSCINVIITKRGIPFIPNLVFLLDCNNFILTNLGPTDLPKLTDKESDRPSIRGPKRANNIRKAWVCEITTLLILHYLKMFVLLRKTDFLGSY